MAFVRRGKGAGGYMAHHRLMIEILKYIFLFMIGTILGWVLEVFWRRFFGKARRWINPGFLNGPWLPLYGFGIIVLYRLSEIPLPLYLRALVFFVVLTILEYIAGVIFSRHFHIKLWDYSNRRANLHGIICPLYSVLWTLLGIIFYFTLFPLLSKDITFLLDNLEFSFFVGAYAGVLVVDIWQSFNVAARIKKIVKSSGERWHVDFEKLKLELRDKVETGIHNRTHYLLPFHGELGQSFKTSLNKHKKDFFKNSP